MGAGSINSVPSGNGVLKIKTTEPMDALFADVSRFWVDAVSEVNIDKRALHFAKLETIELLFSSLKLPKRCQQPQFVLYHQR